MGHCEREGLDRRLACTSRGLTKIAMIKNFCFPFADEGSPETQSNTARARRGQATEKGAQGISNKTGVSRVADDKHQF